MKVIIKGEAKEIAGLVSDIIQDRQDIKITQKINLISEVAKSNCNDLVITYQQMRELYADIR